MARHCLVVLDSPLVAQDLALILQDLTGAAPLLAQDLAEGCALLEGLSPGALLHAFVQAEAAALAATTLPAQVAELGGRIVLLGHAAELEAADGGGQPGWPVLPQPFGTAQVAEVLERLGPVTAPPV